MTWLKIINSTVNTNDLHVIETSFSYLECCKHKRLSGVNFTSIGPFSCQVSITSFARVVGRPAIALVLGPPVKSEGTGSSSHDLLHDCDAKLVNANMVTAHYLSANERLGLLRALSIHSIYFKCAHISYCNRAFISFNNRFDLGRQCLIRG